MREFGVDSGVAKLLTDQFAQEIRCSGEFGSMITAREIEDVIGFERHNMFYGLGLPAAVVTGGLAGGLVGMASVLVGGAVLAGGVVAWWMGG